MLLSSPRRSLPSSLSALILLPLAATITFDCESVVAGGHKFDLSNLGGHHSVSNLAPFTPNVLNSTYTIDICRKLGRDKSVPKLEQCLEGTRVCRIDTIQKPDGETSIDHIIPIARQWEYDHANLDPNIEILPDRESNADSEKEGLRVRLGGGKNDKNKLKQYAIIEFLCPTSEGAKDERRRKSLRGAAAFSEQDADGPPLSAKDHDDDNDDDDDDDSDDHPDWEAAKSTPDEHNGTLTFLSYKEDDRAGTLHLEWITKYACHNYDRNTDPDDTGSGGGGGGWGFFGWLFFLGFFGLAAYVAFFAWINYSKYGASGWDLVPHSDTLRDLPYILGDWVRKVIGTVSSGPSRGGYSAV